MTETELLAWRQIVKDVLLQELIVRNTVLLETLQCRLSWNAKATKQDGVSRTVSLLEEMKTRNHKLFQGHAEAQMLADEMREAIDTLQRLAKDQS